MKLRKSLSIIMAVIVTVAVFSFLGAGTMTAQAAKQASRNVVVVIDPGHGGTGGTNEGAFYNGFIEKELTLATAAAMKQTLEQFEGVTVYLTRHTDTEVSLPARAQYAKSVNADFLFSIHYNASPEHNLFGSEVWIPSAGELYTKGYAFAAAETEELQALGLYQRGIKTRVGSKGDYYGIIRNCTALNIPSVIIEHAHLDHGVDVSFMRKPNSIMDLGRADAIAVAKYFGLKSTTLQLDYSGYQTVKVPVPKGRVYDDTTPPELCTAVKKSYDAASRTLVLNASAADSNSPIIYYAVSFNGGASYSVLLPWNRAVNNADVAVQVPQGATSVIFRAYNQYDKFTDAAPVAIR